MTSSLRKSFTVLETFSRHCQLRKISQSVTSLNIAVPKPDGEPKVYSPKIEEIAKSITQLNLIEVAELSDLLKKKLNLPDVPMGGFGGFVAAPAAPAAEEEQPETAQTSFSVKISGFDEAQKVPLIKEVKQLMEGINLVQAKKYVESVPFVIKQDIGKDEAQKLKDALVKVGAHVEIV